MINSQRNAETMRPTDDEKTKTDSQTTRSTIREREMSNYSTTSPAAGGRARILQAMRRPDLGLGRFSGLYLLAIIALIFSVWVPDVFLTHTTLTVITGGQAITLTLAFGVIVPLAAGVYDLSIAATMGVSTMGVLWGQAHGYPVVATVIAGIVVGCIVGAINGLVVLFGIDSFIATLGMSSVLSAAAYWVTNGQPLANGISTSFVAFSAKSWFGLSPLVYVALLLGIVLWLYMSLRPGGRYLYAVGGNIRAARLAGVNVNKVRFLSLLVSGTVGGLAGVMMASKVGYGDPSSAPSYLLPVLSAAFLGTTQVYPGKANVPGTVIAVAVLATGVTGLQLAGAPAYINDLFNGVALIAAVGLAVHKGRGTPASGPSV